MSKHINYSNTVHTAITPDGKTVLFITDDDGTPKYAYNDQLDCLVRVLPSNPSMGALSRNKDWEIREAVAIHCATDEKLLIRLAGDSETEVRKAVALNPSTTDSTLKRLCADETTSVRITAEFALTERGGNPLAEPYRLNELHDRLLRSLEDGLKAYERCADWSEEMLLHLSNLANHYRWFSTDPMTFWRRALQTADSLEVSNDAYGVVMMWGTALQSKRASWPAQGSVTENGRYTDCIVENEKRKPLNRKRETMSSPFIADIAFTPIASDELLPENLRNCIVDQNNRLDTTLAAQFHDDDYTKWIDGTEPWTGWFRENPYQGDWDVPDAVEVEEQDLFQIRMITDIYPLWSWLEALSREFPAVRIALRGEDEMRALTAHLILVAGEYVVRDVESEENLTNLNLRAAIAPDWGIEGTWVANLLDEDESDGNTDVDANIRCVLTDESASPELLWGMAEELSLNDEQMGLLLAHPNHGKIDSPDEDYWRLGVKSSLDF